MKLKGKKVLITGANRSIGEGIATTFAKNGTDVVISYRSDHSGASSVVKKIQETGSSGKAIYADFSQSKDINLLFNEALEFLKKIDILVNCAGGYDTTPFLSLDFNTFENLFRVGVSSAMQLTQLVAKHMISNNILGSIINISSISGSRPYPNRVAHSTAKAALNMLTQSTALELAEYGIRVNAIAPGSTPYTDNDSAFTYAEEIPLKRTGTPIDQANTALFLASEDSSWVTGQIITVDGGHSLSF